MGIHIDSKLSWSVHFQAVCSRAQKRLYFLRRLRDLASVQTYILLLFYRATNESVISYNIFLWKPVSSVKITSPAHHKHFFKNSRL